MGNRHDSIGLFIAVGLVLSFIAPAGAQDSGSVLVHPGRVLDAVDFKPVAASVKAWPGSQQTGTDGDCSMFGDAPVDSQTSNASDGAFALSIATGNRLYTVTYCAGGYRTRVDRDIPNAGDQVPVVPTPVRIWSVEASSKTTDAYSADVVRTIVFALNQLAYLRSVNPDAYQSAISGYVELLSGGEPVKAKVVGQLSELAGAWAE